jgi:uncharacterized protein with HEPN domain
MQRDDSLLVDMFQAAGRTAEFMSGMGLEQFLADPRTQSAVIHHYRGVDLHEIYKAADTEIARLLESLRSQLPDGAGPPKE